LDGVGHDYLLPSVVRWYEKRAPRALTRIALALEAREEPFAAAEAVSKLIARLDVPSRLSSLNEAALLENASPLVTDEVTISWAFFTQPDRVAGTMPPRHRGHFWISVHSVEIPRKREALSTLTT